jgi:hypothetical protein
MKATINYLNVEIQVSLPNPEEDNTVKVLIHKLAGTYDETLYNSYLKDFQFSAESTDPNNWILEALNWAIIVLKGYGMEYNEETAVVTESSENSTDIPF